AHHYRTALELSRAAGDADGALLLDPAVRFGTLAAERAVRLDQPQGERYYRQTLALLPAEDPRRPKLLADAADAGTTTARDLDQIKAELDEAIAAMRTQGDVTAAANAMQQLAFVTRMKGEGPA